MRGLRAPFFFTLTQTERCLIFLLVSLPVFSAVHEGPCAKSALAKVMKGHKSAVSEFALILPQKENPKELHLYEIGFRKNSVEYIKGRCQVPVVQHISMLE